MIDLSKKLAPFVRRGLLTDLPNNWQVAQGSLEMARTVLSVKPDDADRYRGAPLGRPLLRTPFLVAYTLGQHLRVGAGIRASQRGLHTHLLAVHHHGMPVFDLQLVQTFPHGLARLRRRIDDVDAGRSWWRRRERWLVDAIVPDGRAYRELLRGWIRRAARFDYDGEIPPGVRPEFATLVSFMRHCAVAYPATWRGLGLTGKVRQLWRLVTSPRLLPSSGDRTPGR